MSAPLTAAPTFTQMMGHLRLANNVAKEAMAQGHHPFGAVLVGADHQTVLAQAGNIDTVNHAELLLVQAAYARYSSIELGDCTLYTTFEPCAMCAGAIYWANIGRVVFGAAEAQLLSLTGDHPENPTLSLPCRELFARGQRSIEVHGPFVELADELIAPHQYFWRNER
jgi:tRNA(Arg) A34 adenosine deaminase TadA